VIVVDTNNIEGGEKTSKKKKKKNKGAAGSEGPSVSVQPQPSPSMWAPGPPQQQFPGGMSPMGLPGMMGGGQGMMGGGPGMMGGAPSYAPPPPQPAPAPSKPKEWTPAQYGGYVPPADGKGGGQVLIKSVNGKVVITPVPGTGATVSTTTISPSTTAKKQTTSASSNQTQTTRASQAPPANVLGAKKPLAPSASRASAVPGSPSVQTRNPGGMVNGVGSVNGNKSMSSNNNIENQAPSEETSINGNITNGEDESKIKNKKNKKKRNPDEKLEEINSIFAPRETDCGDMDAADREIEQFKQFCRDSVPAQNRAKVSFDVRNIAFKKK
jgi:hypothetical protein